MRYILGITFAVIAIIIVYFLIIAVIRKRIMFNDRMFYFRKNPLIFCFIFLVMSYFAYILIEGFIINFFQG